MPVLGDVDGVSDVDGVMDGDGSITPVSTSAVGAK